jgi:hypothetical protein
MEKSMISSLIKKNLYRQKFGYFRTFSTDSEWILHEHYLWRPPLVFVVVGGNTSTASEAYLNDLWRHCGSLSGVDHTWNPMLIMLCIYIPHMCCKWIGFIALLQVMAEIYTALFYHPWLNELFFSFLINMTLFGQSLSFWEQAALRIELFIEQTYVSLDQSQRLFVHFFFYGKVT